MGVKKLNIKKIPRYGYQRAYKDYCAEVVNPVSWEVFSTFLEDYFYILNREIITRPYEWKIPYSGGYLRIGVKLVKDSSGAKKREWFYWKWDKVRNTLQWPKASLWMFVPTRGQVKQRHPELENIGQTGLDVHLAIINKDKNAPAYKIVPKRRVGKVVSFKEFLKSIKDGD